MRPGLRRTLVAVLNAAAGTAVAALCHAVRLPCRAPPRAPPPSAVPTPCRRRAGDSGVGGLGSLTAGPRDSPAAVEAAAAPN